MARFDADGSGARLARLAGLLSDETRACVCLALMDGRAWTAGELARSTGVARSTMTEHLTRLVDGGLLAEHRQGRHRYVRIADPEVAELVEHLAARTGPPTPAPSLRTVTAAKRLAHARLCYDHLAGRVGVLLAEAMVGDGRLDGRSGFALTAPGADWLTTVGIDVAALGARRRPLTRMCLDWTERRPHLAGTLGAALCRHLLDRGWLVRIGDHRALRVTDDGLLWLPKLFAVEPAQLAETPDRPERTAHG